MPKTVGKENVILPIDNENNSHDYLGAKMHGKSVITNGSRHKHGFFRNERAQVERLCQE